ncbi:universal stress protein [Natronocalculus amylovorans]|uniref:Universal stress protein n=1 Tax=Natronocalculus amylovorans TaxID=2917812 RepID=A0AAE3FUS6_9EURY|nr:universal stress protein [Natronocalculus amylovorans]MCL9815520.1 universal stress protein [Natronocalculus amylovorans]NUE01966.1 universal stress protein [Halorubraceae archaeon YAN]
MSIQLSQTTNNHELFSRILVIATDDTDVTEAAETGVDVATGYGSSLHALYVVDTAEHWDMVVERREAYGEEAVETVASIGDAHDVSVTKHFRYGNPYKEAKAYIDDHNIELVVAPSPKYTGFDRLVNPTPLADRLSRSVDVPVLVVGPNK